MTKALVFLLACCLAMPSAMLAQSDVTWESLQETPLNSEVRLVLRDGSSVTGLLLRADNDSVVLVLSRPSDVGSPADPSSARGDRERRFSRSQITNVTVREIARAFRTQGPPDPVRVGQVVRGLGTGSKVEVRTLAGRRLRGRIQSIEADGFAVEETRSSGPERIPFDEVTQLKRQDHHVLWASVGIAAGVFGLLLLRGWHAAN